MVRKRTGRGARGARAVRAVPVEDRTDAAPVPGTAAPAAGARLSGGDLDADWQRAESSGEETVGGSVATPDQDVVDEIGRALGVEQDSEDEFHTAAEILAARDRHYWHLERKAADDEDR